MDSASRLHIIACENAIGGSSQLKEHVYGKLDDETKRKADQLVAFPDAAVDRIVPLQQHEDRLKVVVEPFYEWAVDRSQMFEDYVPVEGIHYVDRLEPYIERKLFTVNTGHCSAAYVGFLKGYETIQDAMKDEAVAGHVRAVLEETGAALIHKHGFNPSEHQAYIDTILERFRNPALTDEVSRVGRSRSESCPLATVWSRRPCWLSRADWRIRAWRNPWRRPCCSMFRKIRKAWSCKPPSGISAQATRHPNIPALPESIPSWAS